MVIDITTTGKVTGRPWRKEIWLHSVDGRLYITGIPRPRSWYANLVANPEFTLHLKRGVKAGPSRQGHACLGRDQPAQAVREDAGPVRGPEHY